MLDKKNQFKASANKLQKSFLDSHKNYRRGKISVDNHKNKRSTI